MKKNHRNHFIGWMLAAVMGASLLPQGVYAKPVRSAVYEELMANAVGKINRMPHAFQQTTSDETEEKILSASKELPAKVDLRNYNGKNYVPPVKFQNPFATCWSFAINAATEIAFLYDNGYGVTAGEENNNLDLSEKALCWYAYDHITPSDTVSEIIPSEQLGEGFDHSALKESDPTFPYEYGGTVFMPASVYMAGRGPLWENEEINGWNPFAYRGKNGWYLRNREEDEAAEAARKQFVKKIYYADYHKWLSDEEQIQKLYDKGYKEGEDFDAWFDVFYEENWAEGINIRDWSYSYSKGYAVYDDWTIPDQPEYRNYNRAAVLKDYYLLPSMTKQLSASEFSYEYNPACIEAIKQEIANGRGVNIAISADQSKPGDPLGDRGYLNTKTWAQYCDQPLLMNHSVCVIGYDDGYAKENFTREVDGVEVEGSTPPGDGAFIVQNSWGCVTEEDIEKAIKTEDGDLLFTTPDANHWGIDDTGYFYLSYYDQTIFMPCAAVCYPYEEDPKEERIAQYDLMAANEYLHIDYENAHESMKAANVFTASEDQKLSSIACATVAPDTSVTCQIYLEPEENDPESGIPLLFEPVVSDFLYTGYHRIDLDEAVVLKKGSRYSVVIQGKYTHNGETAANAVVPVMYNVYAYRGVKLTSVINPGESWMYTEQEGWQDLASKKAYLEDSFYKDGIVSFGEEYIKQVCPDKEEFVAVDNFPIKAFGCSQKLQELTVGGKTLTGSDFTICLNKKKVKNKGMKLKVAVKEKTVISLETTDKKSRKYLKYNAKKGILKLKKGAPAGEYAIFLDLAATKSGTYDADRAAVRIVVE